MEEVVKITTHKTCTGNDTEVIEFNDGTIGVRLYPFHELWIPAISVESIPYITSQSKK
jgi:hypothetical protein